MIKKNRLTLGIGGIERNFHNWTKGIYKKIYNITLNGETIKSFLLKLGKDRVLTITIFSQLFIFLLEVLV